MKRPSCQSEQSFCRNARSMRSHPNASHTDNDRMTAVVCNACWSCVCVGLCPHNFGKGQEDKELLKKSSAHFVISRHFFFEKTVCLFRHFKTLSFKSLFRQIKDRTLFRQIKEIDLLWMS